MSSLPFNLFAPRQLAVKQTFNHTQQTHRSFQDCPRAYPERGFSPPPADLIDLIGPRHVQISFIIINQDPSSITRFCFSSRQKRKEKRKKQIILIIPVLLLLSSRHINHHHPRNRWLDHPSEESRIQNPSILNIGRVDWVTRGWKVKVKYPQSLSIYQSRPDFPDAEATSFNASSAPPASAISCASHTLDYSPLPSQI